MENQQHTRTTAINYGLILGGIFILMSVVKYAMGKTYEQEWYSQIIGFLLLIVLIILGIKEFKKKNNGYLSLVQGIKTGLGIALISALLTCLYTFVFAKFIEPEFINNVTEINIQKAVENNPSLSQEAIDMQEKMTKKYFYAFTFGFILILNIFIGFIVSLISSLVLQQKEEY